MIHLVCRCLVRAFLEGVRGSGNHGHCDRGLVGRARGRSEDGRDVVRHRQHDVEEGAEVQNPVEVGDQTF